MTMRTLPSEGLDTIATRSFDPTKRYRYTWPGQKPVEVGGSELTALCRGADADMLAIEEVSRPAKSDDGPTRR